MSLSSGSWSAIDESFVADGEKVIRFLGSAEFGDAATNLTYEFNIGMAHPNKEIFVLAAGRTFSNPGPTANGVTVGGLVMTESADSLNHNHESVPGPPFNPDSVAAQGWCFYRTVSDLSGIQEVSFTVSGGSFYAPYSGMAAYAVYNRPNIGTDRIDFKSAGQRDNSYQGGGDDGPVTLGSLTINANQFWLGMAAQGTGVSAYTGTPTDAGALSDAGNGGTAYYSFCHRPFQTGTTILSTDSWTYSNQAEAGAAAWIFG